MRQLHGNLAFGIKVGTNVNLGQIIFWEIVDFAVSKLVLYFSVLTLVLLIYDIKAYLIYNSTI